MENSFWLKRCFWGIKNFGFRNLYIFCKLIQIYSNIRIFSGIWIIFEYFLHERIILSSSPSRPVLFGPLPISVETNIRIYSNIRIFSSKYWYSYSIRGHFQNPNIIRIFEYFGLNIQKLFDGKILEFLRNKDKIWTIFCEQGVDL